MLMAARTQIVFPRLTGKVDERRDIRRHFQALPSVIDEPSTYSMGHRRLFVDAMQSHALSLLSDEAGQYVDEHRLGFLADDEIEIVRSNDSCPGKLQHRNTENSDARARQSERSDRHEASVRPHCNDVQSRVLPQV